MTEALTEKVLDMALQLFLERGYAGTSLEAIVAAAGVGKHTLYRRFPDKAALFIAVMERAANRVEARIDPAGGSPLDRLRTLGSTMLDCYSQPDAVRFMRVLIAEGPRFPELTDRIAEHGGLTMSRAAEALVREAQAEGLLADGDPEWLARSFLSLTVGMPIYNTLVGLKEFESVSARENHFAKGCALFFAAAAAHPPAK